MVEAGKRGLEILAANFVDRLELLNVADIDIDSSSYRPPVSTAAFRFSHLAGLCCDVADPRIVPSAERAVIPEMK
jgi:hypothetical protein